MPVLGTGLRHKSFVAKGAALLEMLIYIERAAGSLRPGRGNVRAVHGLRGRICAVHVLCVLCMWRIGCGAEGFFSILLHGHFLHKATRANHPKALEVQFQGSSRGDYGWPSAPASNASLMNRPIIACLFTTPLVMLGSRIRSFQP